jgi:signal transduction histidine kinase
LRSAWTRLGLRGRLAISIGAIVVGAFAVVFVAVRAEMSHESSVIRRGESREDHGAPSDNSDSDAGSAVSPIADAHSDVEQTFLVVGAASLLVALLAGYLLAARTTSPLRRFAATAAAVDAGDLTPRFDAAPGSAVELRALAEAFNHMLDRLDAAFARQRRFVSDASHELRNPLAAVRGQLEVLARNETADPAEVRRVEALALAELGRVERLIEELLALARLDEGESLALREVEPAGLLAELAEAAPGGADHGELVAGSLVADPDRIARVVRNLLDNARRHAGPAGRVVIGSAAAGEGMRIWVEDDGPGIPRAEREQVFDRFHRSEVARDRASGGSGLGLAISYAIVAAHDGRIWVEDSPLGGARVCFSLPRFEPTMRKLSPNA